MAQKTWTIQVSIDEEGDDTFADAVLGVDNKMQIHGRGTSRRHPDDESVPQIGDELATARALSELAHELIITAAAHIEARTHKPARLSM